MSDNLPQQKITCPCCQSRLLIGVTDDDSVDVIKYSKSKLIRELETDGNPKPKKEEKEEPTNEAPKNQENQERTLRDWFLNGDKWDEQN